LLADLATEADAGFDNEAHSGVSQVRSERMPRVPIEHDAEVRHGYVFSIDWVEMQRLSASLEMRDELMPEEIEIDPLFRTTPFRTCEASSIEAARGAQVVNGYRQMKGYGHGAAMNRTLPHGGQGSFCLALRAAWQPGETVLLVNDVVRDDA